MNPCNLPHDSKQPFFRHHKLFSDAYFACTIQYNSLQWYHDAGTARMGPPDDDLAVVDPTLRVYGIAGLRVADCSIMPEVTSGNTAAPAMMIGEKAADLIKRKYRLAEYRSV